MPSKSELREALKAAGDVAKEMRRERLNSYMGLPFAVSPYLPKGTVMLMVAEDLYDELVTMNTEQESEDNG